MKTYPGSGADTQADWRSYWLIRIFQELPDEDADQ